MADRQAEDASTARALVAWAAVVVAFCARGYLAVVGSLALLATLPVALGMSAVLITGNSMRPVISAGDVVITAALPAGQPPTLGSVVEFRAAPGSATTGQVMHRVVGANDDGTFVTAGDANALDDSAPLAREQIRGVGVVLARWAGLPLLWAATHRYGALIAWVLLTLLAALVELAGSPRLRRGAGAAAMALLIAAIALPGIGESALSRASASFTDSTALPGNGWTYPAPKPAVRLGFTTSPTSATGGTAFAIQPVVTALDANGAPATGPRSVTLSLAGGTGVLTCKENPVAASQGAARFQGCSVDKAGTYTLVATATSLPSVASGSFAVAVGPAAGLQFAASPGTTTQGSAFATQPSVRILDAGGNLTSSTAAVELALTTSDGAALSCAENPRRAVAGVTTFSGCAVDGPGTYTLTARSGSLTTARSASFQVVAAKLKCSSTAWMATFSWSPTPNAPTTYSLYVDGTKVRATGADGWNSYVQLTSQNVPASQFPAGSSTVEVRKVLDSGKEQVVGTGTVVLGPAYWRTYLCG